MKFTLFQIFQSLKNTAQVPRQSFLLFQLNFKSSPEKIWIRFKFEISAAFEKMN